MSGTIVKTLLLPIGNGPISLDSKGGEHLSHSYREYVKGIEQYATVTPKEIIITPLLRPLDIVAEATFTDKVQYNRLKLNTALYRRLCFCVNAYDTMAGWDIVFEEDGVVMLNDVSIPRLRFVGMRGKVWNQS